MMKSFEYTVTTENATETFFCLENGGYHREDGPARICHFNNGTSYYMWFFQDGLHRYGGPAIEYTTGIQEYWINDNCVSNQVRTWLRDRGYSWETMSDIEKWELEIFMRSLG